MSRGLGDVYKRQDPNGAAAEVAAVHDSLALKDTSGKVYDITVSTSGTLTATARE